MTTGYHFTLYVTGANARSASAIEHLRRICEERLSPEDYQITVVDVSDAVEEANAARILVTPTVVRTRPPPVVRVLGDLSATTKTADALGLPGRLPR